ncbi:peptide-methionine (R)-S-oxide reductase MsrB [Flocculibacter collagenilyticus]|uniref:peptide-methionine (R)-S-oxide reductase MsrB n=1 Tax=Flocculibacter collagenilyticus TaxID=2744479 RepID=UPI0018F75273|nr:peptide-methionine (R)-S-oxide reductase MsrB [Flocculibacter collagenilyticus]
MMKNDAEWKEALTEEQYYICRKKGTEPPFSGKLLYCDKSGEYTCVCCGEPLFQSDDKFDSGCGWPSFSAAINESCIEYTQDNSHGMSRIEITCKKCGSHLGHVFDDGPTESKQRYCVNSISLAFNGE